MTDRLRRLSIRLKIVVSMTLVVLLASVVIGAGVISSTRREAAERAEEANRRLAAGLDNAVARLQSDIFDVTSLPYASEAMLSSVLRPGEDDGARQALRAILLSKAYISFIAATSPDSPGYYLATDNSYGLRDWDTLKTSPILQEFKDSGSDFACYLLPRSDTSVLSANSADRLLFVRTLRDVARGFPTVGYLLVGVPLKYLSDEYADIGNAAARLTDAAGRVVVEAGSPPAFGLSAAEQGNSGMQEIVASGTKYSAVWSRDNILAWTTYCFVSNGSLAPDVASVIVTIALVATAVVVIFFTVAYLFTNLIMSPLNRLLRSMKRFEAGDLGQRIAVNREDEIGQVLHGYNHMVHRIRELVEQNYAVRLREKDAALAVLQAQMNPHFLYNTLDLIYWRAQSAGETDSARDVYALSRLLRLSVGRGHRWIALREEREFLDCYLLLQSEVMGGSLQYDVSFDASVLGLAIPRFILQPLVENAVTHGIDERPGGGTLSVSARREADRLRIEISDDGLGMPPALAQRVFAGGNPGHAIANVRERLDIYFPGGWEWRVDTQAGSGLTLLLVLPAVDEPPPGPARPGEEDQGALGVPTDPS